MTQYIYKDALVAEIERRRRDWHYGSSTEAKFKREECDDILSFLDTLEVKEADLEKNEPVSNDLERAALLHYPKMSRISEPHGFIPADNKSHYLGDANEDNRKAFIVGAQWQKHQNAIEAKEVDLEKEIARVSKNEYFDFTDWKSIARHFFELGLNAKGE